MDERQLYALTHPLSQAAGPAVERQRLTLTRRHPFGFLLLSFLAVDR